MKRITLLLLITLIPSGYSYAQSAKINACLRQIADGKIESVRKQLPELVNQYGDDEPGVTLLQGVVMENAQRAMPHYKKIVDNYPNSEWAPHALWRMIQYYSIVLDTTSAKKTLAKFREKYASSPFLSPASDVVRFAISDAKFSNREKYHESTSDSAENTKKTVAKVEDTATTTPPAIATKDKYGLQVGIYSTKASADSERERFIKTAKLRTEVLEKVVVGERKYAVVIGNYNSEEEAMRAKTTVESQCKCNPLVYKK